MTRPRPPFQLRIRQTARGLDPQESGQYGYKVGSESRAGVGVGDETPGRAGGSIELGADLVGILMWLNYLTFDVISDLAFGEPPGCSTGPQTSLLANNKEHQRKRPGWRR